MSHPPNIDELGNLILLRQALEILAASEHEQQTLYPAERNPEHEMRLIFVDAWDRVRPVFLPSLPNPLRRALGEIEAALEDEPVRWKDIRLAAACASKALPGSASGSRPPRAWDDQIVRARNRLLLRRQV